MLTNCLISQLLAGFLKAQTERKRQKAPRWHLLLSCASVTLFLLKVPPCKLVWHLSPQTNPLWTERVLRDTEERCELSWLHTVTHIYTHTHTHTLEIRDAELSLGSAGRRVISWQSWSVRWHRNTCNTQRSLTVCPRPFVRPWVCIFKGRVCSFHFESRLLLLKHLVLDIKCIFRHSCTFQWKQVICLTWNWS